MEQCGIFSTIPIRQWSPGALPGDIAGNWSGRTWAIKPEATAAEIGAIVAHVRKLTAGAPEDLLMKALTEVALLTKLRNMEPDEAKATVKVYTRRLRDYPADLVLARLHDWPTRHRFFPALEEIVDGLRDSLRFKVLEGLTCVRERRQHIRRDNA